MFLTHQTQAEQLEGRSAESFRFFKDLAETRNFSAGLPFAPHLTPDGKTLLFLRSGPRDMTMRLFRMDVRSGKEEELLSPEQVLHGAEEKLSVEEKARRERQRLTARGFSFFRMDEEGAQVLVALSGKLFVIRLSSKEVLPLPEGPGYWIDPRFSPDGRFVAAVANNELFVIDVAGNSLEQLTTGASETLTHGVAEFVAQEEMSRYSGYWWSPDSSRLAYQETDLSEVEKLYIASPTAPETEPQSYHFPRAGTPNARVRLGIISRDGGETTWIKWDQEKYPYLARVRWDEKKAPLTLLLQTRDQQEEVLYKADPESGELSPLLTEADSAWLNLDENSRIPYWLPDGRAFLWSTERRGSWQLELHRKDGSLQHEITPTDFGYRSLIDVDEDSGAVYVTGGSDPTQVHLFRFPLKGGKATQLTEGEGLHHASFSKNGRAYVLSSALVDGNIRTAVYNRKGKKGVEVPSRAESPPFAPRMEILRIGTNPTFDALLVRPRDFNPKKRYPVFLQVYAGPGHKEVMAIGAKALTSQWIADHGYIVASIDGRGTPGHGRAWERVIRHDLITTALEDQIAGLKALGEKYPELDLSRVVVGGWSFGGYFAAMAVLKRPDIFKVGVAGAPVSAWEDYDTHYTERYLGTPQDSPEAYKKSDVLPYSGLLERPILLIHGLTDDNVYVTHTLKLSAAFFKAGKQHELLLLPGTHMLPDPMENLRLWTRILDFSNVHLGLKQVYDTYPEVSANDRQ